MVRFAHMLFVSRIKSSIYNEWMNEWMNEQKTIDNRRRKSYLIHIMNHDWWATDPRYLLSSSFLCTKEITKDHSLPTLYPKKKQILTYKQPSDCYLLYHHATIQPYQTKPNPLAKYNYLCIQQFQNRRII